MGNKMGTLLTKCKKYYKKGKKEISNKVVSFDTTLGHDVDDHLYFSQKSQQSKPRIERKEEDNDEIRQSSNFESNTQSFVCEICVEQTPLGDSFNVKGCNHFYCTQCVIRYVVSKLEENTTRIQCPVSNCEGVLEPEYCRFILPDNVFDRWGIALCEAVIVGSEKFYCPFQDCSALLINDGRENVVKSVCPACKRVFCVPCKVHWHEGIECKKFQDLKKRGEDSLVRDLAKRKKWRRCPCCKFYVEKTRGCFYIRCRCGYAFCYNCGARSSTSSHTCPRCRQ